MRADVKSASQENLTLSVAFCDPGVRWFCVPRFSLAHPEVILKDDLYEGTEASKLLKERVYDLVVTPEKYRQFCQKHPFSEGSGVSLRTGGQFLLKYETISVKDIPAQPMLYPQIGGYFLSQMERVIAENHLPITLVKNNFNIYQHLIRSTNFLATISRLSVDLRNDGTHRKLIPMSDPTFYLLYLTSNRDKVVKF